MMEAREDSMLSSEEMEILQEIMNIAFGKSAADLADVIESHVVLSVPHIKILQITELPQYFRDHVKEYRKMNIVEQKFWGRFKGDALLVFSSGAGRELIRMLQHDDVEAFESDPVEVLERESLLEVGNILIGACVGKLAEVLRDVVTYTPPMVLIEKNYSEAIPESRYAPDDNAIVLKTDFHFEEGNVSGFLFLVTSSESIAWLKEALHLFIEQYE